MYKIAGKRDMERAVLETPLLSASAALLIQVVGNPDHSLSDIVRIVERDAVLTAHVLRIVNSAAYSLLQPINSIARAVSYLGDGVVIGIAMGYGSSKIMNSTLKGYNAGPGELWRHSLRTAIASREIIKYGDFTSGAGLAFTGGLLHDIGKALISEFLKGTSSEILNKMEKGHAEDYLEVEREITGSDHTIVGSELARRWKLPDPLVEVIRHHHFPQHADASFRPLVYGVHLGDIIAMMGGSGTGCQGV